MEELVELGPAVRIQADDFAVEDGVGAKLRQGGAEGRERFVDVAFAGD